jgi:hypothetical protein
MFWSQGEKAKLRLIVEAWAVSPYIAVAVRGRKDERS